MPGSARLRLCSSDQAKSVTVLLLFLLLSSLSILGCDSNETPFEVSQVRVDLSSLQQQGRCRSIVEMIKLRTLMRNTPTDQVFHVPPDSSTRMTARFPVRTTSSRASFKVWLFSNDTDRDTLYVGEQLDVKIDDDLKAIAMMPDQLRPVMVVCRDPASSDDQQTLFVHNMGSTYPNARSLNWTLNMEETGCEDGSCVEVSPEGQGTLEPGAVAVLTIQSRLLTENVMTARFTARDGDETLGTIPWTLSFSAAEPPARPDAVDDLFTSVVAGRDTLLDLLQNDRSVQPGTDLLLSIVEQPINGQAVIEGGLVRYTAREHFEGMDLFFYAVEEADRRDTAQVQIEVLAPLAALDDFYEVMAASTTDLDVLHHDTRGLAYVQEQSITLEILEPPRQGTARVRDDNTIRYIAPDATGLDSLTYLIRDDVQQSSATVRIRVVEDTPPVLRLVAVDDEYSGVEAGTTVILDVAANDTTFGPTLNDAQITLISTTTTEGNNVSVVGRSVAYTAQVTFEGIDRFEYILSQNGYEDTAIVKVEVGVPSGRPQKTAQEP